MRGSVRYRQIAVGLLLVSLSVFFYALHFAIFRDAHHILLYLLGDIAFVFVEVLIVTLIIHQVLSEREKRAMLGKLNMVIGAFFSEVGTDLLKYFNAFDNNSDKISNHLLIDKNWSKKHFRKIESILKNRDYAIDINKGDLAGLGSFLIDKRGFLLRLLENPNLLEHKSFTELLWAVFHFTEELSHRKRLDGLADSDYEHLAGDIKRAYALLTREWLFYMEHLMADYPYLFSLSVRTNPFDPEASVEIR